MQPAHEVMRGIQPFQTWDETYVHTRHNPLNRTVLMERVDAQGREPWTWVRTAGQGRVFYTAYGHDERTWDKPQFKKLIENAVVWAIDTSKNRFAHRIGSLRGLSWRRGKGWIWSLGDPLNSVTYRF